jgi:uncharacterized protein (PEP-CTERM system associated)
VAQAQEGSAVGGSSVGTLDFKVGVSGTYSTNTQRLGNGGSGLTLEVTPGVRWVGNGARVKGFVDYGLGLQQHTNGNASGNTRHSLNANTTINAWNNQAFVDVSGVVAQQSVSAFGTQPINSLTSANQSQSSSYRVSPYIQGTLPGGVGLTARYTAQTTSSQSSVLGDSTTGSWSLGLNQRNLGRLGWSAQASRTTAQYSGGRDTTSNALQGSLFYSLTPQLTLSAIAGRESNNQLTATAQSYNNTGWGADWRPSDRTSLSFNRSQRYFGSGHSLSFNHRTGHTIWRYSDSRSANDSPLQATTATLGTLFDLLDNLFQTLEPDPVRRAQLVQSELNRLGLPANALVTQNFLTNSATVLRSQVLSVALQGVRGTLTFALNRSVSSRLSKVANLGDDFDTNNSITQNGWSLSYAHRLTPTTSASLTLSDQSNNGSSGISSGSRSYSMGLTTQFGLRTTGGLQLRHTSSSGNTNPYSETAVVGNLNHRF